MWGIFIYSKKKEPISGEISASLFTAQINKDTCTEICEEENLEQSQFTSEDIKYTRSSLFIYLCTEPVCVSASKPNTKVI